MKFLFFLLIIVILAYLYQSTREHFFTGYYPQLYSSNEVPCDYLAYIKPA